MRSTRIDQNSIYISPIQRNKFYDESNEKSNDRSRLDNTLDDLRNLQ